MAFAFLTLAIAKVCLFSTAFVDDDSIFDKEPWSLESCVPKNIVVLESFEDTAGDAMYMLKAKFTSEEDIHELCDTFCLNLHTNGNPINSFAEMQDKATDIPWFPQNGTTRIYYIWPEKVNGEMKENVWGRCECVMWVDDDKKELILQVASM